LFGCGSAVLVLECLQKFFAVFTILVEMDTQLSTDESDVNVSLSLPLRESTNISSSERDYSNKLSYQVLRNAMPSNAGDALRDKSTFYPLQTKAQYMPPTCTLSTESKQIIRRAQDPILQASPRVVHFLYEVF